MRQEEYNVQPLGSVPEIFRTGDLLQEIVQHLEELSDFVALQKTSKHFYEKLKEYSESPGLYFSQQLHINYAKRFFNHLTKMISHFESEVQVTHSQIIPLLRASQLPRDLRDRDLTASKRFYFLLRAAFLGLSMLGVAKGADEGSVSLTVVSFFIMMFITTLLCIEQVPCLSFGDEPLFETFNVTSTIDSFVSAFYLCFKKLLLVVLCLNPVILLPEQIQHPVLYLENKNRADQLKRVDWEIRHLLIEKIDKLKIYLQALLNRITQSDEIVFILESDQKSTKETIEAFLNNLSNYQTALRNLPVEAQLNNAVANEDRVNEETPLLGSKHKEVIIDIEEPLLEFTNIGQFKDFREKSKKYSTTMIESGKQCFSLPFFQKEATQIDAEGKLEEALIGNGQIEHESLQP